MQQLTKRCKTARRSNAICPMALPSCIAPRWQKRFDRLALDVRSQKCLTCTGNLQLFLKLAHVNDAPLSLNCRKYQERNAQHQPTRQGHSREHRVAGAELRIHLDRKSVV
jgi:hypothetical protein